MTIATSPLAVLPTELPPVERQATIPLGFVAGAGVAGIKASGRPDLAIVATQPGPDGVRVAASAAGVFTPNAFAAAPVRLSQAHLAATDPAGNGRFGWATAVLSTSGSANAATGAAGNADQAAIADMLAAALATTTEQTLLLSTGLIGTRLPLDRVRDGIAAVASVLAATDDALTAAAVALQTTDSVTKTATTSLTLPDRDGFAVRPVRVTGIAKGVGMIHPRMATMLSIIVTDATVDPATLHGLLRPAAARTWDQLSVDGDTSTNDTVFVLASGAAGAAAVTAGTREAVELGRAIEAIARDLARQQAADGEGATTLITCQVSGAADDADARAIARTVISSSLVKAAAHGRDPNWGRIAGAAGNARLADEAVLAAAGLPAAAARSRAGTAAELDPDRLRIAIAGHLVFDGRAGGPVPFDREAARAAMESPELLLRLDLGLGEGVGEAFGCDLTEAYVIENSEYST
ncbi:MAG: glutamate N-acetyltransferase / amino-acid N-acetyltransferase [Chloroflexota bacterium]|jgi:glutamate N-acetyltransferase/amino-acid N-acetyltransferase|nr:glutamate N-acetyltransferase / amino-acid N-acetyltransferase [Chloroflexota bacterium]